MNDRVGTPERFSLHVDMHSHMDTCNDRRYRPRRSPMLLPARTYKHSIGGNASIEVAIMVFGASVVAESKPPTKPNGTDLRLQAQRLLAATFPKVDRAVIAAACFSGEGKHSAMGRHFMACQLAGLWLDGECCGAAVFSVMTLPSAVGSEAECRSCLQVSAST